MTKLREQCLSVLLGNTKTGKWNVTRNQKLKAVKFHERRTDSRKKGKQNKTKTSQTEAIEPVDAKSFYSFKKGMDQLREK